MTISRIDKAKGHSYVIDGMQAMGVTTALGKGIPKPALPYWAAKSVAETVADMDEGALRGLCMSGRDAAVSYLKGVPWRQRDAAAVRGTEIHRLAERMINYGEVPREEHAGHVDAMKRFFDEWEPTALLSERTVGHYKFLYAGTFDVVAELPDGQRLLLDYKTSKGVYAETAMQLAAYRHAQYYVGDDGTEMPMSEVGITGAAVVHLREDGYEVIPVRTDERVFHAFQHALAVARIADEMDTWVHPAVQPGTEIL